MSNKDSKDRASLTAGERALRRDRCQRDYLAQLPVVRQAMVALLSALDAHVLPDVALQQLAYTAETEIAALWGTIERLRLFP